MTKKMAVLHTSFVFINVEPVFQKLYEEILPDIQIVDFVDSDVLAAVKRAGGIKNSHVQRMVHLALAAESAGVDLIFSACSSLGPTMDVARQLVDIPIVKIDDAMTQKAADEGNTVGVMATVPTTLQPTIDLIQGSAQKIGKKVETKPYLCEGAFDVLMSGNRERHDQMVLEGARRLAAEVDLIVLAQASMSRLAPALSQDVGKDVLSSPRLAMNYVRSLFDQMPVA
jgi:Asp/Glu/hydantoin racemase